MSIKKLNFIPAIVGIITCSVNYSLADSPKEAPDNTWISVSGKVAKVDEGKFLLNYDDGEITVEFDAWEKKKAYKLEPGEQVRVVGIVDDDLFEKRTIEGSRVFVESENTYFFANPSDEEDMLSIFTPKDGLHTTLQGTVTEIISENEFRMMASSTLIRVETDEMEDNPLDNEGFQKVKEGDRVSVAGKFDKDFLEGHELVAESLVTLRKNK